MAEPYKLPKIVAVDFDGTLVSDKFPEIGQPNITLIHVCKILRIYRVKLILWTCRNGEHLDKAVEFLAQPEIGLVFDAVNENLPEVQELFGGDARKVYADLYIDDKAISRWQDPIYWCKMLEVDPSAFRELNRTQYSSMAHVAATRNG